MEKKKTIEFEGKLFTQIPGYDKYYVSLDANIYGNTLKKGLLKLNYDRAKKELDYVKINICDNNKQRKSLLLHRIVAETFIPRHESKEELFVDHIDDDKYNNHKDNLQWLTTKENAAKRKKPKLYKKTSWKVKFIPNDPDIKESIFDGCKAVAEFFEITRQTIIDSCRRGTIIKDLDGYFEYIKTVEDLLGEIWKNIVIDDKKTSYHISSEGRVKNKHGQLLKPMIANGNYLKVNISNKKHLVHRLVCSAFHDTIEGKYTVNHKNGKRNDNRAENLEWADRFDQAKDQVERNKKLKIKIELELA